MYSISDMQGVLYDNDVPRDQLKSLPLADIPASEHRVKAIVGHHALPHDQYEYDVLFAGESQPIRLPQSHITDSDLIRKYWGAKRRV